jgi:hypothetical protein
MVFLGGAGLVRAADAEVFTDPASAGPDYKIQGEFDGKVGDARLGAQIIALGDGKFQAVFYRGGLPGAGWDKSDRIRIDGKTEGEATRFRKEGSWAGELTGDSFTGQTDKGENFQLKRVTRHSATEGLKPPAGALVLFDGTNADAWNNGKITPEGWLKCGTNTKKSFQNFTIHFEFRVPFKPKARGQERGNSGLFLQDRYEVQILDSFGLKEEAHECAALYNQKQPDLNMSYPPLTWQTYDIDFQTAQFGADGKKTHNAVVTVKHNGVVVHDKYEPPTTGPVGKPEDATGGTFQIQDHGNPVVTRNIWVVER